MNRNLIRKLHKWIFLFMGVFMLAWLVSGVVMILPQTWFGAYTRFDRSDTDYSQATLAPAQVIALIKQLEGPTADIKSVSLRTVDSRILYEVSLDNKSYRIDAQSGELFAFTPELSEKIIRRNFDIAAPLLESKHLTLHDSTYPRGPLPVYRLRFSDDPQASYYMQENNLRMFRSSVLSKLRGAIVSLHILEPIEMLTGSRDLRHNLLIATGALSLLGALAGVILLLPRKNTARQ